MVQQVQPAPELVNKVKFVCQILGDGQFYSDGRIVITLSLSNVAVNIVRNDSLILVLQTAVKPKAYHAGYWVLHLEHLYDAASDRVLLTGVDDKDLFPEYVK